MKAEEFRPEKVAVLGLGTMGHGIAQTFAVAGFSVGCFDEEPAARASVVDRVSTSLKTFQEVGLIEASSIAPSLARLTVSTSEAEAVKGAQFVVEAVREDLETKQKLFPRVEQLVSRECILASNTSTFPMTQIAVDMKHPERAVDTHWFNPPQICPLVEVVPGEKTAEATVEATISLMERIGKMPVRVRQELPGFLVNRIQAALIREVIDLMERGVASPEDIDRAVRGSMGLRLAAVGPLEIWDFAGLDICGRVHEHLVKDICSERKLPATIEKLLSAGHFGFKTGKGIFEHDPETSAERLAQRDRHYLELVKLFYKKPQGPQKSPSSS